MAPRLDARLDAGALSFETGGAVLATHGGRTSILLPRTMFYPEGGGQLGDIGTLAIGAHQLRIADTQIEDGVIHHVLDGAVPEAVADAFRTSAALEIVVQGTVEATRRQDNTVQHTAQHALSRALADAARADTVSARLGLTSCTIDVARPGIKDADLHAAGASETDNRSRAWPIAGSSRPRPRE